MGRRKNGPQGDRDGFGNKKASGPETENAFEPGFLQGSATGSRAAAAEKEEYPAGSGARAPYDVEETFVRRDTEKGGQWPPLWGYAVRYQMERPQQPNHVGAAIDRVVVLYPTNLKMGT